MKSKKLRMILQKELHLISMSDAENIFKFERLADHEISKINKDYPSGLLNITILWNAIH
jgi:hypothetical protein